MGILQGVGKFFMWALIGGFFLIIILGLIGANLSTEKDISTASSSAKVECGPSDGVCPAGCNWLRDLDCIHDQNEPFDVKKLGISFSILKAYKNTCVTPYVGKFNYIVVEMKVKNYGDEIQRNIFSPTWFFITDRKNVVKPLYFAPNFEFDRCTVKIPKSIDVDIDTILPGTSRIVYLLFELEDENMIDMDNALLVFDIDPDKTGEEFVWKLRVS